MRDFLGICKKVVLGFLFALLGFVIVWQGVRQFYFKPLKESIEKEYVVSDASIQRSVDRPLPDSIYILPSIEKNSTEFIKYALRKDGDALAKANALKINKRGGVYYWDSNGGKPLKAVTQMGSRPNEYFLRKFTTFTAEDGSGSVVIWHDTYDQKGRCSNGYNADYHERRFNQKREFFGHSSFFPPRPDKWCQTLQEKLRNLGLIGDIDHRGETFVRALRTLLGFNNGEINE